MKRTQKMILVPSEISEHSKPIDSILNTLDSEMQRILSMKSLSTELKLAKYNQILQRHSRMQEQKHKPYELDIIEQNEDINDAEILENIPKTKLGAAKLFLHHVRANPSIQIENNGEIIVDGQKIFGSHITDLVHDFSRERKTHASSALGADEVAAALKRANIPLESIGNKQRLAYFLQRGRRGRWQWGEE